MAMAHEALRNFEFFLFFFYFFLDIGILDILTKGKKFLGYRLCKY
jgi:hypothetical protein